MGLDLYSHTGLYLWLTKWRFSSTRSFEIPQPAQPEALAFLEGPESSEKFADAISRFWDDSCVEDFEEIDDIHTEEMAHLLKPFLLALSMSQVRGLELAERKLRLEKCQRILWESYLRNAKILRAREKSINHLVLKFCKKQDRESAILRRQELKNLENQIIVPPEIFKNQNLTHADDETRNFWIALIELSFLESAILYSQISDELDAVKFLEENPKESWKQDSRFRKGAQGALEGAPLDPQVGKQSIGILHLPNKASVREKLRGEVFRPGHILPSMSLDEIVAKEYHQDVEILQAAQKRSEEKYKRRSGENSEDYDTSDSDRGEAFEKSEAEQRAWDDWVDENPRGSGNKMINRG